MLNRKTPETLATNVTIKAPGDEFKVPVVFYNRSQADREAFLKSMLETEEGKKDMEHVNREMFLYVVKEFDGKQPTYDGVKEAEANFPGLILGVFTVFHELRTVSVTKN